MSAVNPVNAVIRVNAVQTPLASVAGGRLFGFGLKGDESIEPSLNRRFLLLAGG